MTASVPQDGVARLVAAVSEIRDQSDRKIKVSGHFKLYGNVECPETLIMVGAR